MPDTALGFLRNLGDGTTTTSVTPVQVSGLSGVSQVSAGYDYGLAVHTVGFILR